MPGPLGQMGEMVSVSHFDMSMLTFPAWVDGFLPLGHCPGTAVKGCEIVKYKPQIHHRKMESTPPTTNPFLHINPKVNAAHHMVLSPGHVRVYHKLDIISTVIAPRLKRSHLWKRCLTRWRLSCLIDRTPSNILKWSTQ